MDRQIDALLQVRLLGGFAVTTSGGTDLTPRRRKLRALIACLALPPGKAWPRERLAALLWGDRDDEQARGSLRQALAALRRSLGEPGPLYADRETVRFDPGAVSVDAVEFARLAEAAELERAAELFCGELLDTPTLAGAGFADWLMVERTRLHDLAVDVLAQLVDSQSGGVAIVTAQRLLQLDPAREETHRTLMRLYAARSDRAQALRQYQICRDSLRRELDVKPAPETERLFRELQASAQAGERLKGLRLEHRPTAILAADIVGYSHLVEQDEAGTLAALRSRRKNVLEPLLSRYHGRIVKTTGDGVLVEFTSAVDAVECAVGLQKALIAANADLPEDRQILLRVGVNLGDVIIEDSDLYGDGVNIAARLAAMAEPGGIYVSRTVFDHVRNKVNLRFEDLGEQALKNIRKPINVYRIVGMGVAARGVTHELPLPLKPSIAVLPFTNMSDDPEQQYFSDGITEDIITELSRFRQLFVIARNSSFAYKGLSKDLKQVGRDLGVRYLLEGSVRKSAERVRITAELIDATTGSRIWGERYDRNLQDIFALQDEITETIVAAIEPELNSAERERSCRRPPESLDAWACYHQGMWHLYQINAKDAAAAERMFRRALEIEPQFTQALSAAAYLNFQKVFFNFPDARDETLQRALADALTAVALDDRDAFAHQTLGRILSLQDEHDEAIAEQRLAIDLNPSFALAHHGLATALVRAGRYSEALNECDKAIRLSPFDPYRWAFFATRARALLHLEDYDSAVKWCRKAARLTTMFWPHAHLTCALGHLGRKVEAKAALDDLLRMKPDFSPALLWSTISIRDNRAAYDHYVEGLRKAGLPES